MPLILRTVAQSIPHNHSKQVHTITRYVHPTRLRPGDTEVPLHEISDRQLADLATLFPDEYLAPCLDRQLEPARPVEIEDESTPDLDETKPLPPRIVRRSASPGLRPVAEEEDDEEEQEGEGEGDLESADEDEGDEGDEEGDELATVPLYSAQRDYLMLNARNAIAFIDQNKERSAFLGKCYQAEKARLDGPRKTVLAAFTSAGVGAE